MKIANRQEMVDCSQQSFVYTDIKSNGEPFYVGVGTFRRVHKPTRNTIHTRICKKYPDWTRSIVFIGSRSDCLLEEIRLIKVHGRLNNGSGKLANLTDGGDGGTGRVVTNDEKLKQSATMKIKYSTNEARELFRQRTTKIFTDPSVRERHHESVMKAWSDETNRATHKKNTMLAMAQPEIKRKQKEGLAKYHATEEARLKRSETSKRVMADPATKQKLKTSLKAAMNRPETKAKMHKVLIECQNRPSVVAKKSCATANLHAAKKKFIAETGYTGQYSKITKTMLSVLTFV